MDNASQAIGKYLFTNSYKQSSKLESLLDVK